MTMSDNHSSFHNLFIELENAVSEEEINKVTAKMINHGENIVPGLLQYANSRPFIASKREKVVQILVKLGYPANQAAIPFFIGLISDVNSPGWEIAVKALKDIGMPIIPIVQDAIHEYLRDPDYYSPLLQGLCQFMENLNVDVITPLMPELLILLNIGTDINWVDEYALWPIQKIGTPHADQAIPILAKKIVSARSEHIRKLSIQALECFDQASVAHLATLLEGCLTDNSTMIRSQAQKTLNWLLKKVNESSNDA